MIGRFFGKSFLELVIIQPFLFKLYLISIKPINQFFSITILRIRNKLNIRFICTHKIFINSSKIICLNLIPSTIKYTV